MNIFNDKSQTDTYVIYDQFHLGAQHHYHEVVSGFNNAISRYQFHKVFQPQCVLGLCTIEYFLHTYDYVPFISDIKKFYKQQ